MNAPYKWPRQLKAAYLLAVLVVADWITKDFLVFGTPKDTDFRAVPRLTIGIGASYPFNGSASAGKFYFAIFTPHRF